MLCFLVPGPTPGMHGCDTRPSSGLWDCQVLKSRQLAETASAGGGAEAAELQHQLAAAKAHAQVLQQQLATEQAAAGSKLQEARRCAEKATQKLHGVEDECASLGQEVAELQVWPSAPLAQYCGSGLDVIC